MARLRRRAEDTKIRKFQENPVKGRRLLEEPRSLIPLAVTAMRLYLIPLLVFLVSSGMLFYGAVLFLLLVSTDFLDGYLARKLKVSSKFGAYFDVTTDFILVFSMFTAFIAKGFCPYWVLLLIITAFAQFLLTSLYTEKIYDPVGKYYGSMLYGAIGLRFFLSGQFFYDIVTVGIVAFAAASILSRVTYLVKIRGDKHVAYSSA